MKLLRDTWLLFRSNLRATLRQPVWVIVSLIQPLYFLVLFAPLLEGVANAPGFPPGGALNVFMPGLLIQLGLFSCAFVGFGLIADLRAGVVERMRVTPVSRLAPLLGRALRDVLILVAQAALLLGLAWPFGLRPDPAGAGLVLGLLVGLGLLMASCSYALALALKSEDALAPMLNTVVQPLLLLSGILLPMTLAPRWLRAVASANPLSHIVDAARALFNGRLDDAVVGRGVAILAVLVVLALWWAARSFRQATA
jgi:ABC-2 type transport system permease protein